MIKSGRFPFSLCIHLIVLIFYYGNFALADSVVIRCDQLFDKSIPTTSNPLPVLPPSRLSKSVTIAHQGSYRLQLEADYHDQGISQSGMDPVMEVAVQSLQKWLQERRVFPWGELDISHGNDFFLGYKGQSRSGVYIQTKFKKGSQQSPEIWGLEFQHLSPDKKQRWTVQVTLMKNISDRNEDLIYLSTRTFYSDLQSNQKNSSSKPRVVTSTPAFLQREEYLKGKFLFKSTSGRDFLMRPQIVEQQDVEKLKKRILDPQRFYPILLISSQYFREDYFQPVLEPNLLMNQVQAQAEVYVLDPYVGADLVLPGFVKMMSPTWGKNLNIQEVDYYQFSASDIQSIGDKSFFQRIKAKIIDFYFARNQVQGVNQPVSVSEIE